MSEPYQPIPDKTQASVDRLVGQRIEGHMVVERLGEGGMGNVYRAESLGGEKQVVIKILKPELVGNEETAKRIFEEAAAVSAVKSDGIVAILAKGKLPDGRFYLVMDFLDGLQLDFAQRNSGGRFPVDEALQILEQIAIALEAAHAWGIVHGNLKPSNIFLVKQPDGSRKVKLLDFGLAKYGYVSGRMVSGEVQVIGTPDFMAPEQARAEPVTPSTDLYALGSIAFMMLTGRGVFIGKTANDVVSQHVTAVPPKPSSLEPFVPESLDRLIGELLQKDPSNRPLNVAEVRVRLDGLKKLMSPRLQSPEHSISPMLRKKKRSIVAPLLGVAVVLVAAASVAAWFFTQSAPEPVGVQPPPPVTAAAPVPVPVVVEPSPAPPPPKERPPPVERPAVERSERPAPKPLVPKTAPSAAALSERVTHLDARLRKKAAKDPELLQEGMLKLNKQRMLLTGSPDNDERKGIAKDLDTFEQVYLGK